MGVLSLIHITLTAFIISKNVAFILAVVGLFVLAGYTGILYCPLFGWAG